MPTPSKFTAEVREALLEVKKVGGPDTLACARARISDETLRRWLQRGKDAEEGSRWREFYLDYQDAKAHPQIRSLGLLYKEVPDNPVLNWKYIERAVKGYAPPIAAPPPSVGTVNVTLSFFETDRSALGEVIEGEVVDEQSEPGADPVPAELAAGTSPKPA